MCKNLAIPFAVASFYKQQAQSKARRLEALKLAAEDGLFVDSTTTSTPRGVQDHADGAQVVGDLQGLEPLSNAGVFDNERGY